MDKSAGLTVEEIAKADLAAGSPSDVGLGPVPGAAPIPTAEGMGKEDEDFFTRMLKCSPAELTAAELQSIVGITPTQALGEVMRMSNDKAGYSLVRALEGLTAKQAKGMLTGLIAALGEMPSIEKLSALPLAPAEMKFSIQALRRAMAGVQAKNVRFIMPTEVVKDFLSVVEAHVRGRPKIVKQGLEFMLDNARTVFVPNTSSLTDANIQGMLTAMDLVTKFEHVTIPLATEKLIRLVLAHIPMRVQDNPRKFAILTGLSGTRVAAIAHYSPNGMYNDKFKLDPYFVGAVTKMLAYLEKVPIPTGVSSSVFHQMGEHTHRVGAGKLFAAYYTYIVQRYNFVLSFAHARFALERININPMTFTYDALEQKNPGAPPGFAKGYNTPLNQITKLVELRQIRAVADGDRMADIATREHAVYSRAFAMCAKIRATQMVYSMPLKGSKMAVIGVSEGYDRFLWRHWDVSYYDITPKVMHGINVQPCDVKVPAALDAALAGKAGVLFDTAVNGSGSHNFSKEKALVECGYAKNLALYEAQSEGLLRHRPIWFAMKVFLPPMDIGHVPAWVERLWGNYEVRIIKPGVLHSDEFFMVGRKSNIGADHNRRLYDMGILRVTVMVDAGNIAAMANLAAGDYEPFFAPENARAQDTLTSEDYPVVRASGGTIEKDKLLPGTFKSQVSAEEFVRMLDQAASAAAVEPVVPPKTPEATSARSEAPVRDGGGGGAPKISFTGAQVIPHESEDLVIIRYFLVPKSLTPEEREKVEEIRDSGTQEEHDRFVRAQQAVFAARATNTFKSLVRCAAGSLSATEADWEAYRYFEKTEDAVLKMLLASAQLRAKHLTVGSNVGSPSSTPTKTM